MIRLPDETEPAPKRFLCERCGGTGHQQAGCWNMRTGKYDAPAGMCDQCNGEGLLGLVPEARLAETA